MPDIGPLSPTRNRNTETISLPSNIDPHIVAKLHTIVSAIDNATKTFNSGSSGITDTDGRMRGAISSLEAQSSGQMITAFTTHYGPATMSDGKKASTALASATIHLGNIKEVINEQLPTIQTGMTAYNSAVAYENAPANSLTPSEASNLQNQINNMCSALGLIASALPPANSGISGITIGGACATGIQPGAKLPDFNDTYILNESANGDKGNLSRVEGTGGASNTEKAPSAAAQVIAKGAGPAMRGIEKAFSKMPEPMQKAFAALIGGAGNSLPSALTSGITSGSTLSTFLTSALGSTVGTYVVDALKLSVGKEAASATTITMLTLAGGVGMGTLTVYVIKPLVLDKVFPSKSPQPQPAIVTVSHPRQGETVTTIIQSDGSKEIIDVKPGGETIDTKEDANGKVISTKTVPAG